jgi:hypothetical protein
MEITPNLDPNPDPKSNPNPDPDLDPNHSYLNDHHFISRNRICLQ